MVIRMPKERMVALISLILLSYIQKLIILFQGIFIVCILPLLFMDYEKLDDTRSH